MDGSRLRDFLQHTLTLWGIEGRIDPGEPPLLAQLQVDGFAMIAIEHAPAGSPFRWIVRWQRAASPSAERARARPCGSLVGVLAALRLALRIEPGRSVRIAPAADWEDSGAAASDAADAAQSSAPPLPNTRPDAHRSHPQPPAERAVASRPGDAALQPARLPVTVLTGFLGSGKTTLLRRILHHPGFERTAVIVNEFGEVGIDHDLLESSDEQLIELANGCLCCRVRSDLARTLEDLALRRSAGTLPAFERVLIETSGLADPAPILHALMTDPTVSQRYRLDGVITTADAVAGCATLQAHAQSVRQVGVADRIVITKGDLPEADVESTETAVRRINPSARVVRAVQGAIQPCELLRGDRGLHAFVPVFSMGSEELTMPTGLRPAPAPDHGMTSVCLTREQPLHAVTLSLFVATLGENLGAGLLRMKAIVQVAERPDNPAVIHGVQHVYHAPAWLPRWPDAERRTRMVFIGQRLSAQWIEGLLDLLQDEVRAALTADSQAA